VVEIVGDSDWAQAIRQQILCVAGCSSGVLISGPNGTGKELIARSIHAHSDRARKPFIPVDCTSFVSELFPSHMFGHVRGAFTGAHYESLGCFRAAEGGTLFLDEIGELAPHLQAKLLRALEEKTVVPVGSTEPIPVDARIIAATNRELHKDVRAGRFRKDLYYRLNVVQLKTAPLKDRPEDIKPLAAHFLAALCREEGLPVTRIGVTAVGVLRSHPWPGNVRELRNVLERALLFDEGGVLTGESLSLLLDDHRSDDGRATAGGAMPADALPEGIHTSQQAADQAASACPRCAGDDETWLSLAELKRWHIQKTLEHTGYNQTAAAKLLEVTPRVLSRLIKQHGIDVSRSRRGRPSKAR
jgi:DNA-binding NtrC family response regulator